MSRQHTPPLGPTVLLSLLVGLAGAGCPSGPAPDPAEPPSDPTEPDANAPPVDPNVPREDASAQSPPHSNPSSNPTQVARPDASHGTLPRPRVTTHSLIERYRLGQRIRRATRLERRYSLRVESDLVGSAEGASERNREYLVHINDALRGHVRSADIEIMADHLRILPVGDSRPQVTVELGPLHGMRLRCQLTGNDQFSCDGRNADTSEDMTGVSVQNTSLLPGRPVSVGESWHLEGPEANRFLGTLEGDATIQFLLDQEDSSYRGESCYRVVYSLGGTVPQRVLGSTLSASLTGSGEYYFCRASGLILYHRQERTTSFAGAVRRANREIPVERSEQFILEEETFPTNPGP